MGRFGMIVGLVVFLAFCSYADGYYGSVGYDFGDRTPVSIKLADIDGDGASEVLAIVQGTWVEAGTGEEYTGMKLYALEWSLEDSTFLYMTSIRLDELLGGAFPLEFDVGDLITDHPGDEIVFVAMEEGKGYVRIFGWDGTTISLLSQSSNIFETSCEFAWGCVIADVDSDGVDEVVVGLNGLDTLNLQQTMENFDAGTENPVVGPLIHAKLTIIDGENVEWYSISDGLVYLLRGADLDENGYAEIITSTGDLDYTNVNTLINDIMDFIPQFAGSEKAPVSGWSSFSLSGLLKIFSKASPFLTGNRGSIKLCALKQRLAPLLKMAEKGAKSAKEKSGPNLNVDIVRIETPLDPPFPELPGNLIVTSVHSYEHGSFTSLCERPGITPWVEVSNVDTGAVCVKSVCLNCNAINDIIVNLDFVRLTEIVTSKWIDEYTGVPEYCDTMYYPEPRHIPYSLIGSPISGDISLFSNTGTEYWSYSFDPFSMDVFMPDSFVITGENGIVLENLNTVLSSLDGLYTDLRSHLPDSTEWVLVQLPILTPPLSRGKITTYKRSGWYWDEEVGDFLSSMVAALNRIFAVSIDLNYGNINGFIGDFNTGFSVYHDEWVTWAEDSLAPYVGAYDSCLAIHNEWALEYYDSTQSGGTPPDEPNIQWPYYPGGEPEFEPPDFPGTIADANAYLYDFDGTQIWSGTAETGPGAFFGSGVTMNLDNDASPDFVFTYSDIGVMKQGFRGGLYIYSSTPLYGIEEIPASMGLNALLQNTPNPFGRETIIRYSIVYPAHIDIEIYDISGRRIRTLTNDVKKPGYYTMVWDGKDGEGKDVSSGVYFYRLRAGKFISSRKMIVVK